MKALFVGIFPFICFARSITIPVPAITVTNTNFVAGYKPTDKIILQIKIKNIFWETYERIYQHGFSDATKNYTDVTPLSLGRKESTVIPQSLTFGSSGYGYYHATDGLANKLIIHEDVMCTNNTLANELYYVATFAMTDNPAFDNGDPVKAYIIVEVANEFIFIYEESLFKINNDTEASSLGYENVGYKHYFFPNLKTTFELRFKVNGYQALTDVTVDAYFPKSVQLSLEKDISVILSGVEKIQNFLKNYVIDMKRNRISFIIPNLDPVIDRILSFNAYNDEKMLTLYKSKRIFANIDITYCPYKTCDSVNGIQTTILQVKRFVSPSYVPDVLKPIRIKDANSGKCWRLNSDNYIGLTTSCKDNFNWYANGSIMHTITKLYLNKDKFTLDPHKKYLFYHHLVMVYGWRFAGIAMQPLGNVVKLSERTVYFKDASMFPRKRFKILTGLSNPDDVMLKSIVYESSDKAIYICNPGGDLAKRPNCFYTSNLGASWKALPSAVTNIIFITTSSWVLYAKCHRGKMHCSVIMHSDGSNQIQFHKEEDWNKLRFEGTTVEAYNFDDEDLGDEVKEVWPGEIIGVSSGGIYFRDMDAWKKVFFWGN